MQALRDLGIDTSIFDEEGIETISLEGLGISDGDLAQFNLDADEPITIPTLPMLGFDLPDEEELLIAVTEALSAINLNTLGQDVDEQLGQFGLQLRQGEVYLNRLGAQQLNAKSRRSAGSLHWADSLCLIACGRWSKSPARWARSCRS